MGKLSRPRTEPNQGTSWVPIVLIISLVVGLQALVAIGVLVMIFAGAFFVVKTGHEVVAEAQQQHHQHVNELMKRQQEAVERQKEEIERQKAFANQPKKNDPPKVEPPPKFNPPPVAPGARDYDLVVILDPKRDAVHGRWEVVGRELHGKDGGGVPRIEIPYEPPAEYDFTVSFSQPGLRNGISLIMPKPAGGSFFWHIGRDNGSGFGFHSRGAGLDRTIPGLIKVNTIYTTTVQVRREGVRGILDGKELLNHPTNFADLETDGWRQLRNPKLLAVACDDPTVFHQVRILEITGAGKRTRGD